MTAALPLRRHLAMHALFAATLWLCTSSAASADQAISSTFLERYCIDCHGSELQEADLRLDQMDQRPAALQKQTWHQVLQKVSQRQMPPEDAAQPNDQERETFRSWVMQTHGQIDSQTARDHWSFHPPLRPDVPSIHTVNPIDAFIIAKLREQGLEPAPRENRRTLLRRVTLDLTGLLPTLDETTAFLNDSDTFEVAYGRVVDRLLASPHYGERWAQHWLDVIRWAETVGFETNGERRDAWHYRDWVIRSLNEDKPYNVFVSDQLIGDATGQDAALGFLVAGPANLPGQIGRDEEAMRQARQDELDEVVQTVSQSLFGLTIGCARCHDHKFDPIRQQDYYSMQAIFAGLQYGYRRMRGPLNDEWTSLIPAARDRLDQSRAQLETMRLALSLREPLQEVQTETFDAVSADAVRMEIHATTNGPASLYEFEVFSSEATDSAPLNVALASAGAIPSASSFALANQTRHFDNLVDGSVDQRQAFPWVAAAGGAAWIQVDLPKPTSIDHITWHGGSSIPADYEIKVRDPLTKRWETVANSRDRLPRSDDMRPAESISLVSGSPETLERLVHLLALIRKQTQDLNRLSAGPQTYAASFLDSPTPTRLLRRGDPMQPQEEVIAAVPAALSREPVGANPLNEFERRRLLVDHLTRQDHPLTSRVIVNRVWQHHFGVGLVETASDLGRMGAAPTHPELLDWLAVEFVENGWSLKLLHRMIVTSETYTQSSQPRELALRIDADSKLLWRFPPRRLDAEAIRDSILAASGTFNATMYGRGFDFFDQRGGLSDYRPKETFDVEGWRRMIYAHKIRMQSVSVFGAFDCPDAGQMMPQRNQSITPIQSLGLMNSPFLNRQATLFAEQIRQRTGGDLSEAVHLAFEIALTRPATSREHQVLLQLATDHGLDQACRVIFNTSEFVFLR